MIKEAWAKIGVPGSSLLRNKDKVKGEPETVSDEIPVMVQLDRVKLATQQEQLHCKKLTSRRFQG